jgi:hypothetical protein
MQCIFKLIKIKESLEKKIEHPKSFSLKDDFLSTQKEK